MPFIRAIGLEEIWNGEMKACLVEGRTVLLIRQGDAVLAVEDRCAHLGVPLSRGRLEGGVLTCSAHEWQYDAGTGRGVNPAAACLVSFPVRIENGGIWVDVSGGR